MVCHIKPLLPAHHRHQRICQTLQQRHHLAQENNMNEQCSCSTNVCIIIHNYLSNLAYMHISQLTD